MTKKTTPSKVSILGIYSEGLEPVQDFLENYAGSMENLALVVAHYIDHGLLKKTLTQIKPLTTMQIVEGVDQMELLPNTIYVAPIGQKVSITKTNRLFFHSTLFKIQEELNKSQERFDLAVRGSSDGIWDWFPQLDKAYFSPYFSGLFEIESNQTVGMSTMVDHIHPDDLAGTQAALEAHLRHKRPYRVETRLRTKGNVYRWFFVSGQAIWDEHGAPIRMAGSFTDIHDRKIFEKQLIRTERNLKVAQRLALIGDWEMNLLEDKLMWSDEVFHIFGLEPQEFEANFQACMSHIHPDDQDYVRDTYFTSLNERSAYHIFHRIVTKDGTIKQVECHGESFYDEAGNPTYSIGTVQDITQLKDIENALKHNLRIQQLEQEVLKRNAQKESKLEDTVNFYLKELEAIYKGMTCSILKLKGDRLYNWFSSSIPEDFTKVVEGMKIGPNEGSCGTAAYLNQKIIVADIATNELWVNFKTEALKVGLKSCWSYPIVNSNNIVIGTFAMYYNEIKCPTKDEENAIERAKNILQIIIENKAFEQELIVTNERYQYVTKVTSDAIWDWDLVNQKVTWSEAFLIKFGYEIKHKDQELIERWASHIHPEDYENVTTSFKNTITGKGTEWHAAYRFQKADGEYIYMRDKGNIIRNQEGKAIRVVGAMFDVTHEVKETLERQKSEKEKEIWYTILNAINSNDVLEKGFQIIIKQLCDFFECLYGEVWLANIDNTCLLYRVNHTITERAALMRGEKSYTYIKENQGLAGATMFEKKIIHWPDLQNSELIRKDYALLAGLNAGLGIPVLYNNTIIAQFTFFAEKPFDNEKISSSLIENITQQFGAYVQKHKIDNELTQYFNLSPVFLCISGADGRLKKVNPYLMKKTGYSEKELLERKIIDFVHPDDYEETYNEIGRIYQGFPTRQFENRMITKSGEAMWFEWSALPIIEEGLTYAIATDITEKKKTREERKILIEELTKSNKELKQFSYITSHNLRSPLTNMVGVFELLDFSNIQDEETSMLLEILKNSTHNLNEVLNDLISLLIIKENSNLSTSNMSFSSTFGAVKKSINLLIEQSQTQIQTDFLAIDQVNFNHGYLESIFLNMITNSIKYAIPGEAPCIQIYSQKTENGATQLVFEDKGLGFDLEKVGDRVFGLFQKFHQHKDSRGIGLYLVHSQITSLGGTIKVQSEVNHGTKFTITFKG